MLALADQNARCVIDYRRVIDPIVQPEPTELAQGSPHASVERALEVDERVQVQGVPEHGCVLRENVIERGESARGASDQPHTLTARASPSSEATQSDKRTDSGNDNDDDAQHFGTFDDDIAKIFPEFATQQTCPSLQSLSFNVEEGDEYDRYLQGISSAGGVEGVEVEKRREYERKGRRKR